MNRSLCDVLEEMRTMNKTRNFAALLGHIEEVQIMGNRMEAGLYEGRNYHNLCKKTKEEKEELKRLRKKADKLRKEVGEEPKKDKGLNPHY